MLKLLKLPITLGLGLSRMAFELVFGMSKGLIALVFGLIGLTLGLFKGIGALIVIGGIIAFVGWMFDRGYNSGAHRRQPAVAQENDDFQSYYRQHMQ